MKPSDPRLIKLRERLSRYKYDSIEEYSLSAQEHDEYINAVPPADIAHGTNEVIELHPATESEKRFYREFRKRFSEYKDRHPSAGL